MTVDDINDDAFYYNTLGPGPRRGLVYIGSHLRFILTARPELGEFFKLLDEPVGVFMLPGAKEVTLVRTSSAWLLGGPLPTFGAGRTAPPGPTLLTDDE